MITDYFKLSMKNIKKRKLRSGLTMLGIIIAIMTIFLLISLSLGLEFVVKEQFRMLGTDKFFILSKAQMGAPGTTQPASLTITDVNNIEKVNGVKDVSYANMATAEIEYNKEKRYAYAIGVPLDKLTMLTESLSIKIDEGRFPREGELGKVVLGYQYKYSNFFSREVKTGDKITINGKEFKVVGILTKIGNPSDDQSIYMNIVDFKDLFNTKEDVYEIIVQTQPGTNITQVANDVERKLMRTRDVTEKTIDFMIMTPEELLNSFQMILNIVTGFLLGIAAISLFVGAIGIANTMFTSVLERTREIGIMKAVGAKNSDVLKIFVIEAGTLGMIGGIIGTILGYFAGRIIEVIANNALGTSLLKIYSPWYLWVGCIFFSFLIGAVSGFVPSLKASKLRAVDALRYE
jgi:putative ABC transport system permease protein